MELLAREDYSLLRSYLLEKIVSLLGVYSTEKVKKIVHVVPNILQVAAAALSWLFMYTCPLLPIEDSIKVARYHKKERYENSRLFL